MENEKLEPAGEIKLAEPKRYEQCEWCYQFDNDEPQIFAWTGEEPSDEDPQINFSIGNIEGAFISFTDKKTQRVFKIFARELTEAGQELRKIEAKQKESFRKDLENLDKQIKENSNENKN